MPPAQTNNEDDEALARALQEEYEKEYRRRSMNQYLRQSTATTTSSSSTTTTTPNAHPPATAPLEQQQHQQSVETVLTDEDFARRIEQEMVQAELRHASRKRMPPRRGYSNASSISSSSLRPPLRSQSSLDLGMIPTTDAQLARRLEQEERDEQLARQWIAEEQARRETADRKRCGLCCAFRKLISILISLVLLGVAVVLIMIFIGEGDKLGDFIPNPDQFRSEDPFNNANPDDANRWRTGGSGLTMTLVNALDDTWQESFGTAVSEWDAGDPDSLTLRTERESAQSVCRAVDNKIKVCNGNYGETNWRGINKINLANGWIYSSTARMNDYYVGGSAREQRQYTMCHEIGHGFGLPHTDEDFRNKDLGNCLDYTNNPQNNMSPDRPNFVFLANLYGTVDGSPVPELNPSSSQSQEQPVSGGGGRHLRNSESWDIPNHIRQASEQVDKLLDAGVVQPHWRKLHESEFGQAHEIDLGDGFTVQVHMLL